MLSEAKAYDDANVMIRFDANGMLIDAIKYSFDSLKY